MNAMVVSPCIDKYGHLSILSDALSSSMVCILLHLRLYLRLIVYFGGSKSWQPSWVALHAMCICFKMRDMLLSSIYNGVVVCDSVGNDWLLSICIGEQMGNDDKQHGEFHWETM
jgi:hypothetical protein